METFVASVCRRLGTCVELGGPKDPTIDKPGLGLGLDYSWPSAQKTGMPAESVPTSTGLTPISSAEKAFSATPAGNEDGLQLSINSPAAPPAQPTHPPLALASFSCELCDAAGFASRNALFKHLHAVHAHHRRQIAVEKTALAFAYIGTGICSHSSIGGIIHVKV